MAEFTPINTQEEFDAMIGKRLEREREKAREEFKDYETIKSTNASLQKSIEALNTEKADLTAKLETANKDNTALKLDALKTKVCIDKKLPLEMRSRLSGEDEEALSADADILAKFVNQPYVQPLKDNETPTANAGELALKELANKLIKE